MKVNLNCILKVYLIHFEKSSVPGINWFLHFLSWHKKPLDFARDKLRKKSQGCNHFFTSIL